MPSTCAHRQAQHRELHHCGLRCLTVEIYDQEITELVPRYLLAEVGHGRSYAVTESILALWNALLEELGNGWIDHFFKLLSLDLSDKQQILAV